MSLMRKFDHNEVGTDYVCGDIHGHFDIVTQLLHDIGFNHTTDRLFALGDLVDRGPKCLELIRWMQYPWFYSILGNHEIFLLDYCDPDNMIDCDPTPPLQYYWSQEEYIWRVNGGDWWFDPNCTLADKQRLYSYIQTLPIAFQLTHHDKMIGCIHAEMPDQYNWQQLSKLLECNQHPMQFVNDNQWLCASLHWARSKYKTGDIDITDGVDAVCVGHTIVTTPTVLGNTLYMDTGSYRTGSITIMSLSQVISIVENYRGHN